MYRVLVGSISPEGEALLTSYLNVFMPDAKIEPLSLAGIKGTVKRQVPKADTILAILDESLYQACAGVVDDVLALPKVHKYVDDDGLKQFLISKFGRIDGGVSSDEADVVPPDVLMKENGMMNEDDEYIPKETDFYTKASDEPTIPPDKLIAGQDEIINTVQESGFGDLIVTDYEQDDSDAIISKLNDTIAQKDVMIRNLTLQLKDGANEDVGVFVDKIHSLEADLEAKTDEISKLEEEAYVSLGKVAKAEQVIKDSETLKAQLKTVNEDKSALIYEKDKLTNEVNLLTKQIDDLKLQVAELEVLRGSIKEHEATIVALNNSIEEKEKAIESANAELGVLQEQVTKGDAIADELEATKDELSKAQLDCQNLKVDFDAKVTKLSEAEEELSVVKGKLSQSVSEYDELKSDYTTKVAELQKVNESLSSITAQLEEKENELNDCNSELETLRGTVESNDAELETLRGTVTELGETIDKLNKEIDNRKMIESNLTDEIQTLQLDSDKLSHKDAEIDMLRADAEENKNIIKSLNVKIDDLTQELDKAQDDVLVFTAKGFNAEKRAQTLTDEKAELEKSVAELKASEESLRKQLETVNEELSGVRQQYKELSEVDIANKSTLTDLDKKVSMLTSDLAKANETISDYKTKYEDSVAENEKSANEIKLLNESLAEARASDGLLAEAQHNLLEERRKTAKLSSELEVMKKNDDSGKADELRKEIVRLNDALAKAQESGGSSEEITLMKKELEESRERCANLELDIVEKDEQLKELNEGIFIQMANLASPKVAYNLKVSLPEKLDGSFYCVTGGSAESNVSVYSLLKKSCIALSNKRILVVDLVTDTSVDREFGIRGITSPISWLNGADSFKGFLADTKFKNVKVLSTALAYLNDMFLLQVDWKKRLTELQGYADIVILNVGCLDNLVSKILFNSFSQIMQTYVIAKATPVNLRTIILNLTGFSPISPNVTVSCVNFNEKASKMMYQMLAKSYKSQILGETDVLKL